VNPPKQGRWVIGLHACSEALAVRPHAIAEVVLRRDWQHSESLIEIRSKLQKASGRAPVREASREQLDQFGSGHQGVALLLTEDPQLDWQQLAEDKPSVVLILDGIEDPQNLGSILRTAWLTGVDGLLIPQDRAVGLTPTACKIASGGAEHVPVEVHANFGSPIERLKKLGFWVYGLTEKGQSRPWDLKLPKKVVWVIGSEERGMRVPTERSCDEFVCIPQVQTGSSYNAAIAAAMALAETCRQFEKPKSFQK